MNAPASSPAKFRFRAAFEEIRPEMADLREDELLSVNLDIPQAVATVLGGTPKREEHRASMVAAHPTYDLTDYDRISTYALAASFAYTRQLAASEPPEPVNKLTAELEPLYSMLRSDVRLLSERGIVHDPKLQVNPGPVGAKKMGIDTLILASVIRDNWAVVQNKLPLTLDELERSEDLDERLTRAIAFKEFGNEARAEATDTQSSVHAARSQVRRGPTIVEFARWHYEDADDIAPSLYAKRRRRKKGAAQRIPERDPQTDLGPTRAKTNGAGGTAYDGAVPLVTVPPGHNGEDPFDA